MFQYEKWKGNELGEFSWSCYKCLNIFSILFDSVVQMISIVYKIILVLVSKVVFFSLKC